MAEATNLLKEFYEGDRGKTDSVLPSCNLLLVLSSRPT